MPRIEAVIKLFDFRKIGKEVPICRSLAVGEIRSERDGAFDGDEWDPPIWQYVTHEILKNAKIEITEVDLGWYAMRVSLQALEKTCPVSRCIAEQHDQGLGAALLTGCWANYPTDAEAIGLPRPNRGQGNSGIQPRKGKRGRKQLEDAEVVERRNILAAWTRAKSAGVDRKTFCSDRKISTKRLGRVIEWNATRIRRGQE